MNDTKSPKKVTNYMSGSAKPPEVFDTLYVFSCTAYLVTPLDLVTVF